MRSIFRCVRECGKRRGEERRREGEKRTNAVDFDIRCREHGPDLQVVLDSKDVNV